MRQNAGEFRLMPFNTLGVLGASVSVPDTTATSSAQGQAQGTASGQSRSASWGSLDINMIRQYQSLMEDSMLYGTGFATIPPVAPETQEQKEARKLREWFSQFNKRMDTILYNANGTFALMELGISNDDYAKLILSTHSSINAKTIVMPTRWGKISIFNADTRRDSIDWEKFTKEVDVK